MPDEKSKPPAKASAEYPHVDRLIELGSDKDDKDSEDPTPPDSREPREKSLWKLLLQLRPFLPYLTRLVPVLDVVAAPLQNAGMASDVRKAVAQSMADATAKLESTQRELRTALTSALDQQTLQLKRLDEELTRLRQASEKVATAQADVVRDLDRLGKLARLYVAGLGVMLLALIVMTGVLLAHSH
jgi:hypothetical protein